MMLTDFSGYVVIQIIYKPQLVYYLHNIFLFPYVKALCKRATSDTVVSSYVDLSYN